MERSSGGRSARLLLIEDSPADARYLREVFKEAKIRNHLHIVNDARFASVPIVVLAPSELHAERLRDEGMDAHCCLLKPISAQGLLELVNRIDTLGVALVTDEAA